MQPPGARIFANIAANIRQLHGDTQVSRPGQRRVIFHAHEDRHHDTDGARHTSAVLTDIAQRLVVTPLDVPLKTLE